MKYACALLCLFSSAWAELLLLDEVMSPEDQNKTGIATLSRTQRTYLEQWLNENMALASSMPPAEIVTFSLNLNLQGGRVLQLSNGTLWEVNPADLLISNGWILPCTITLSPNTNSDFPFTLRNTSSKEQVRVRQAAPPPTPPPQPTPK